MSRTTRQFSYQHRRKQQGIRQRLTANEDAAQQGVHTRSIAPEAPFECAQGRNRHDKYTLIRVTRRLIERKWDAARIARHLQSKFKLSYSEALEVADRELRHWEKPLEGPVTPKARKREQAKRRAEAEQQQRRNQRRLEERKKAKQPKIEPKKDPLDLVLHPERPQWEFLNKTAPNLLRAENMRPLETLLEQPSVRPLEEWRPAGKHVHLMTDHPFPFLQLIKPGTA